MITKQLPGFKPLCYIKKDLYLYHKGGIYRFKRNMLQKEMAIYPTTIKECMRVSSRLFRTEPKYAVTIDDKSMIIVGHRKMLLVNVQDKNIFSFAKSRTGFSDPLNVCVGQENWLAVWGDYGNNANHDAIYIYGLTHDYKTEIVYSFKKGQIRHIHNIIPKKSGGYYIFTGDQEKEAGIYAADAFFKKVGPVKIGKQQYRAVVGFDTEHGLLYATDAVNEKNYIYLLKKDRYLEKIDSINGSCIYGKAYNGKYYFSTTVEPDENCKGLMSWISRKRGKGILSNAVHLVEVDENLNTRIILKMEKDILPMKLMQYGSIQFPRGLSDEFWCYPVAVKRQDGVALYLHV